MVPRVEPVDSPDNLVDAPGEETPKQPEKSSKRREGAHPAITKHPSLQSPTKTREGAVPGRVEEVTEVEWHNRIHRDQGHGGEEDLGEIGSLPV